MKLFNFLVLAALIAFSANAFAEELSPAMTTVLAIKQNEFKGYKPGVKEMREKLHKLGKIATPDEIEQVMRGEKKDWIVVDIRKPSQYNGGHIVVDGKKMLHVGRQQPMAVLQKNVMQVKDNKEIIKKAPKNIIIVCRSAMKVSVDYASYAAVGFNDVKVAGVLDWAKSCRPLNSSTNIEDAALTKKKVKMKKHSDGKYYWEKCEICQ